MRRALFALTCTLVACVDDDPKPWPISDARAPLDVEAPPPPPPLLPPPPSATVAPTSSAPAPIVPPFEEGYLERQPTKCWMASAPPQPCIGRGPCPPPPLWANVTCPPTLAHHDKAAHKPPSKNLPRAPRGGYTEKVTLSGRCYHAARTPKCPDPAHCNPSGTEVQCP